MSKRKTADELFADLERRREAAVNALTQEIARDQAALDKKREALRRLTHQHQPRRGRPFPTGAQRRNWSRILAQLPDSFKARDVRMVRGLRDLRPSEIFAAITRWIDTGRVIRARRGFYRKVVTTDPRPPEHAHPAAPKAITRKAGHLDGLLPPQRMPRGAAVPELDRAPIAEPAPTAIADVVLQHERRGDCWVIQHCPLCGWRHSLGMDPDSAPSETLGERGAKCSQTKSYVLRWDGHSEIGPAAEPAHPDPKMQRAM